MVKIAIIKKCDKSQKAALFTVSTKQKETGNSFWRKI